MPPERVDHLGRPVAPRRRVEVPGEEDRVARFELRSEQIQERLHPPDPDAALDLQDLGLGGRTQPHHVDGVGVRRVVDVRDRDDLARRDQEPAPEARCSPRAAGSGIARSCGVGAPRTSRALEPTSASEPNGSCSPTTSASAAWMASTTFENCPCTPPSRMLNVMTFRRIVPSPRAFGRRSGRREYAGREEGERQGDDRCSAHVAEPSVPGWRLGRPSR